MSLQNSFTIIKSGIHGEKRGKSCGRLEQVRRAIVISEKTPLNLFLSWCCFLPTLLSALIFTGRSKYLGGCIGNEWGNLDDWVDVLTISRGALQVKFLMYLFACPHYSFTKSHCCLFALWYTWSYTRRRLKENKTWAQAQDGWVWLWGGQRQQIKQWHSLMWFFFSHKRVLQFDYTSFQKWSSNITSFSTPFSQTQPQRQNSLKGTTTKVQRRIQHHEGLTTKDWSWGRPDTSHNHKGNQLSSKKM